MIFDYKMFFKIIVTGMRPAAAGATTARKRHPLGYRQTAGRSLLIYTYARTGAGKRTLIAGMQTTVCKVMK